MDLRITNGYPSSESGPRDDFNGSQKASLYYYLFVLSKKWPTLTSQPQHNIQLVRVKSQSVTTLCIIVVVVQTLVCDLNRSCNKHGERYISLCNI